MKLFSLRTKMTAQESLDELWAWRIKFTKVKLELAENQCVGAQRVRSLHDEGVARALQLYNLKRLNKWEMALLGMLKEDLIPRTADPIKLAGEPLMTFEYN